jgi:hypothetical protein
MDEADLKRALVKSIRAQGGIGRRIEDKYTVGWPDLIMAPAGSPVFFAEAKLIKVGAKLTCTEIQRSRLDELWRPPHVYSCILGYGFRHERLYVGNFGDKLDDCLSIPRPDRLDSTSWQISHLLRALANRDQCGITNHIETGTPHDAPDTPYTSAVARHLSRPR